MGELDRSEDALTKHLPLLADEWKEQQGYDPLNHYYLIIMSIFP